MTDAHEEPSFPSSEVDALVPLLEHPNLAIVRTAAEELGKLKERGASAALPLAKLLCGFWPWTYTPIERIRIKRPGTRDGVSADRIVHTIIKSLRNIGTAAIPNLRRALTGPPASAYNAAEALRVLGKPAKDAAGDLADAMRRAFLTDDFCDFDNDNICCKFIHALIAVGEARDAVPVFVEMLQECLGDDDCEFYVGNIECICLAFEEFGCEAKEAVPVLIGILRFDRPSWGEVAGGVCPGNLTLCMAAARALGGIGREAERAIPHLSYVAALSDERMQCQDELVERMGGYYESDEAFYEDHEAAVIDEAADVAREAIARILGNKAEQPKEPASEEASTDVPNFYLEDEIVAEAAWDTEDTEEDEESPPWRAFLANADEDEEDNVTDILQPSDELDDEVPSDEELRRRFADEDEDADVPTVPTVPANPATPAGTEDEGEEAEDEEQEEAGGEENADADADINDPLLAGSAVEDEDEDEDGEGGNATGEGASTDVPNVDSEDEIEEAAGNTEETDGDEDPTLALTDFDEENNATEIVQPKQSSGTSAASATSDDNTDDEE